MGKLKISFFSKLIIFSSLIGLISIFVMLFSKIAFYKLENKDEINKYILEINQIHINLYEFKASKDTTIINEIIYKFDDLILKLNQGDSREELKLSYLFIEYKNLVLNYKQLVINKGVNENVGTEGKFRESVHRVEDLFYKLKDKNLLIQILQIRRREKDYILRNKSEYINQVLNLLIQTEKQINNSNSIKNKKEILEELNNYRLNFIILTSLIGKQHQSEKQIKKIEKQINLIIQEYKNHISQDANSYLISQNYIFIISIALLLIISYFLSKGISEPIESLVKATDIIARGDYNYRAEVKSFDEIGKFTYLFNIMIDKLQNAFKQIENDKKELENRVNERTEYLIKILEENKQANTELEKIRLELINKNFEIVNNLEKEQELNQLKTKFIRTVSHEFRTPLTVILNSTYLLEKFHIDNNLEKFKKQMDLVTKSVISITKLLDDLLIVEKLDIEKVDLNITNFNLPLFIDSLTLEYKASYGFAIEIIDTCNYKEIKTDMKILSYIFSNILTNAIIYSKQSKYIEVKINEEYNNFVIEVIDRGIGISENDMKYIFEAFFRGANTFNIPGIGIGLNITKRYLDLLKGKITIFSELNYGTRVLIDLPKELNIVTDELL